MPNVWKPSWSATYGDVTQLASFVLTFQTLPSVYEIHAVPVRSTAMEFGAAPPTRQPRWPMSLKTADGGSKL